MTNILLILSILIFSFFRMRLLMMYFQQNEYRNNWFIKFIFEKLKLVDKKLTFCLIIIWIVSFKIPQINWLIIPTLLAFAINESKYTKNAKKKLSMTDRVKRIIGISLLLVTALVLAIAFKLPVIVTAIITIQFLPFALIISNLILTPMEKRIQNKFKNEAIEKLKKLNTITIGITGSYGKTSTKHILAHILSGNLPVFWTPGSVNTEMGVTRIIREKLSPVHKYFIVEMGAYFKGSIEKLCKLVNPKHGIITSIGQAHYEHFKTQKTIAETKFELGEWVNKNNGFLVINSNQIKDEFVPKNINVIKVGNESKIYISNVNQTRDGLYFTFHNESESHSVFAPIYGEHQAGNIALSIEMALKLGMSMSTILVMLKTLPQINHRLEVTKRSDGVTMIDDAYNSNPDGFKSGLELLQSLRKGRRILVTPGMVELGQVHSEAHYQIGKLAGERVDVAIIIRSDRIPSFLKGFEETATSETSLIEVKSFNAAQEWLNKNLVSGDIVLLENDLPDVYESKMSL